jgi:hypothetical protein
VDDDINVSRSRVNDIGDRIRIIVGAFGVTQDKPRGGMLYFVPYGDSRTEATGLQRVLRFSHNKMQVAGVPLQDGSLHLKDATQVTVHDLTRQSLTKAIIMNLHRVTCGCIREKGLDYVKNVVGLSLEIAW